MVSPSLGISRTLFLPDLIWAQDRRGRFRAFDRGEDPAGWLGRASADVPVVTQWDDGRHAGRAPGILATSTASEPSLVAGMLADLGPEPGQRILDVGAGTGWTAALLTAVAGEGNVVGVELDPAMARAARKRLRAAGVGTEIVTGDGAKGWAERGPYDRIHCAYGVLRIPAAWMEQTVAGSVIVVPWRTGFVRRGAVVRLVVQGDGTASGAFTRPAEVMQSRPERLTWPPPIDYLPDTGTWPDGTVQSTTKLRVQDVDGAAAFIVGLRVPDAVFAASETGTAWLYSVSERSWAAVFSGHDEAEVYQCGARRLWDEVEAAYAWWRERGCPDITRFGLTVEPHGETVWLDRA
ncbi:methyltransferase domain-containing protein [Actinomadura fibrosa]|uniref:Protein-L-isoaspartate O-methyltransferase n=1 Tax=Actinomadura fibrosa TaxID=111802 RepID=A0ABW2Y0L8_9ACTN|nr:methyltransferase domain-containing protein [Actinomadura fibrosa]